MDRAIPVLGNEEIELYMRTYYSLLRSSGEVQVRSLEETHSGINASLHQGAAGHEPDLLAFVYSAMRLPLCINKVRLVLLGQSAEVFARGGYPAVEAWTTMKAKARRRKMFFDGAETLAVFINSISDIDDLIPMLTTYQIEWNKLHFRLIRGGIAPKTDAGRLDLPDFKHALALSDDDFSRLAQIWGNQFLPTLRLLAKKEIRLAVRLLAGSRTDYRRATQGWWRHVLANCGVKGIHDRPVYFVSSNMHALPNLLSSYYTLIETELLAYLQTDNPENLREARQQLAESTPPGSTRNLLSYLLRKYLRTAAGKQHYAARLKHETDLGIHNVRRPLNLDVGVQVIELAKLNPRFLDPRLKLNGADWAKLRNSQTLMVNVDYPLGMAAYQLLSQISASVGQLKGVYIMGKAATLNGRVGDVMIPNVAYDEHSQNTYLFDNCFAAEDVAPYLKHGTVLDNQKAVTVRGTFLQNKKFMHVFYKEGYTDIEMEVGPYLSAMYENLYPKRYPVNEIVKLFQNLPYDIGVLHYASDTPYSKRQSLLSKSMLYFGMDSTYACTIAIVRRILATEMGAS